MQKRANNLHSSIEKFVEALHKYQTATLQINQVARRQLQETRHICHNLKRIADSIGV